MTEPLKKSKRSLVAAACRAIDQLEQAPVLHRLAEATGMSPFHFHRVFTRAVGLTTKEYAMASRDERARAALSRRRSVTEAI